MQPTALLSTDCPNLKLVARGKVRDIYEIDSGHLLFVARPSSRQRVAYSCHFPSIEYFKELLPT